MDKSFLHVVNIIMALNIQFFLSTYYYTLAFCNDFATVFENTEQSVVKPIESEMKLKEHMCEAIRFHLKILEYDELFIYFSNSVSI